MYTYYFVHVRAVPKISVPPQTATSVFHRELWVRPPVLLKEIAFFPGRVVGQNQL